MSSVIEDVYFEILLRVPVRTASICKCVCKSWFQIISDRSFVKLHLNLNIERNNTRLMLVHLINEGYSISYDSLSSTSLNEDAIFSVDIPFKSLGYFVMLLGSCNGLFCLKYTNYVMNKEFLCLWNPATTQLKKVTKSARNHEKYEKGICCLGYDRKTDDYKLIAVVDLDGQKNSSLVEVYTLGTDSWKSSQILPYNIISLSKKVFFNGAWHWLGKKSKNDTSKLIISLDVDEKFDELQLPSKLLKDEHSSMSVGVLDGCLNVVVKVSADFEFWVMRDYGVQESWAKHYSIAFEKANYLRVISSFENGKILLVTSHKLLIYDPKNSSATEPNKRFSMMHYDADTFVESLVSLDSNTDVGR